MSLFRKRGMALGKRAWRWRKRAWRGAIIKVARGNNMLLCFINQELFLKLLYFTNMAT